MQAIQHHGTIAASAEATDRAFQAAQARSPAAPDRESNAARSTRDDDGAAHKGIDAAAMRRCIRAGLWP